MEKIEIRLSGKSSSHYHITTWPEDISPKPGYKCGEKILYIDKIQAEGFGEGTKEIQRLVKISLQNSEIQGRVVLYAENTNTSNTHPLGFYYKLGFRCIDTKLNEDCRQWILHGGEKNTAPQIYNSPNASIEELKKSIMYLPPENIEQCLTYKFRRTQFSLSQIEKSTKNCDFLDKELQ